MGNEREDMLDGSPLSPVSDLLIKKLKSKEFIRRHLLCFHCHSLQPIIYSGSLDNYFIQVQITNEVISSSEGIVRITVESSPPTSKL